MRNFARNGQTQARLGLLSGVVRTRRCNRTARRNPTIFVQIPSAESCVNPERGIGHAHVRFVDVVEHHPVIAFPVHNRGQRHHRKIAKRNLQRSRRRDQARSPRDKALSNSCHRWRCDKAAESAQRLTLRPKWRQIMPRLAAPQSISSICVMCSNLADALASSSGNVPRRRRTAPPHPPFPWPQFPIERNLVVRQRFGRKQFLGRKIERNARFGFGFVLRQPFFQQLAEFGIALFQDRGPASGSSARRSQSEYASTEAARGEPFKIESSPKKSPVPIECEIHAARHCSV